MSPAEQIIGPFWDAVFGFFGDLTLAGFISFLRITAIVLSVIFFFGIFIVESKFKKLKIAMEGKIDEEGLPSKMPPKGAFQKGWDEIEKLVQFKREADYKQAVVKADALLEDVIKRMGLPNLEVALNQNKLTENHLTNINDIKLAHNVKSKITSSPNFHLTQEEAKNWVEVYRTAFVEWGILE
ncbi:hypothetical protein C4553_02205 [Candidatus Parcubacteria bacterium]|nr:MAG: hypothetical protein C4553_02205 [Candidatus Parcubacteria bacterium]